MTTTTTAGKIHHVTPEERLASKDATIDAIDVAYLERMVRKERARLCRFYLLCIAGFALVLLAARCARADNVLISGGTLLNNISESGRVGPLVDVTARKSGVLMNMDGHIGLTHVFRSNFGGHENKGSAQFVTAGLAKVLPHRGLEYRLGGGLLAAVHYDWGSHYDGPMTRQTYKAECLFCGWFAQGSVSRGPLELTLRYTSTDPNFWTSYNGALVMLGWRL